MRSNIDKVFSSLKRSDFLPLEVRPQAKLDQPLPIGYGQTNSQPSTVRLMLEWLDVEPGDKVLDVGSGSGWTTALLSRLTGDDGRVFAVEKIAELVDFGRANCRRAGIDNVEFHRAGKQVGWPEAAPYDRILVSASSSDLPEDLIDQLRSGGKLVIPVKRTIYEVTKLSSTELDIMTHPGFVFVPLT